MLVGIKVCKFVYIYIPECHLLKFKRAVLNVDDLDLVSRSALETKMNAVFC